MIYCIITSGKPLVELPENILWQVITGYLLAGSIVGPGGFNFINEMVQVSQYGNQFLL
jgi:Kef-type K+ transport system membrane component KefB